MVKLIDTLIFSAFARFSLNSSCSSQGETLEFTLDFKVIERKNMLALFAFDISTGIFSLPSYHIVQ